MNIIQIITLPILGYIAWIIYSMHGAEEKKKKLYIHWEQVLGEVVKNTQSFCRKTFLMLLSTDMLRKIVNIFRPYVPS